MMTFAAGHGERNAARRVPVVAVAGVWLWRRGEVPGAAARCKRAF